MIIAITGATGFIGKRLIKHHLLANDEVRFLTRNPNILNDFTGARGYLGDLSVNSLEYENFLDGVDVLYHLAAELKNENQMWSVNVSGTKNLLEAANGRVKRWVQLSSTGVYGKPRDAVITEESEVHPHNLYEKSKAEADRMVEDYCQSNNISFCILRPSNVYGPDMTNQSLFHLIRLFSIGLFFYVGKKGAIMNYIHVDNVIHALTLCGKSTLPKRHHTFIVSDYCSIEKMAEVISTSIGKSTPKLRLPTILVRVITLLCEQFPKSPLKQSRIDAITGRSTYSSSLIAETLGYHNLVSIEQGFSELTKWWKNSRG
jgi:nucleoside-diphosphate-sugar epimerase